MDLESLTQEQLQLTLKISDILAMEDLSVAAAVLASFDWNLQNALTQLQIGDAPPLQPKQIVPPSQIYSYNSGEEYNYDNGQNENYEQEEGDNNDQYEYLFNQKKKIFQEQYVSLVPLQKTLSEPNKELYILQNMKLRAKQSRTHRQEYFAELMKRSESICKNILQTNKQNNTKFNQNRRKLQNNKSFINYLYQNYSPNVNFTFGTFFLNLTRSYLEDKFLLVYIHSVQTEVQNKFKKIVELILRQKEIARFVNQNCITYGMFDNSDDYQVLQKYVPLKDLPGFALFRLNKSKRSEEFISSYKISAQGEIFLEWAAKSMGIPLKKKDKSHIQSQENALKEQVKREQLKKKKEAEQLNNKIKQQKQMIAHRDIMKEQDQLWAQLQQTFKHKKQVSLDRREQIKTKEEQLQHRIAEASKWIEPEAGPNVIEIRFRMPISGQSKNRNFLLEQKVQKMFVFVDCFCRDEFQQKFNDFDLKQSFPQLSLLDKRDKTIGEIFEGSGRQNIVVRQL